MASVRRTDLDSASAEHPLRQDKEDEKLTSSVAKKVLSSSSVQSSAAMCTPTASSESIDTSTCLESVNSTTTPRKKKSKRKKKKITQSSSSSSKGEVKELGLHKSLFYAGIQSGKLPRDFALVPEVSEAFLRETIESCQLGGSDNLTSVIGMQIFRCKAQLNEVASKSFSNEEYSIFALKCTKLFDSISADFFSFFSSYLLKDLSSKEKEASYISGLNEDTQERTVALRRFLDGLEQLVVETETQKYATLQKKIRKRVNFIRLKNDLEGKYSEIKEGIGEIRKLFSLWKALCNDPFALIMLQKNTLKELFGEKAGEMRSVEEGAKQFLALIQFQKSTVVNGRKLFGEEDLYKFENFARNFPKEFSAMATFGFSRNLRESKNFFLRLLAKKQKFISPENSVENNRSSSSASAMSDKEEEKKIFEICLPVLACYFVLETSFIMENYLLPSISKVASTKQESFGKMVSIFEHFTKEKKSVETIEIGNYPVLSTQPNFKQYLDQLQRDSAQIFSGVISQFNLSAESFGYPQRDSETFMDWEGIFSQLAPSFKRWYAGFFDKLENHISRHIEWGRKLIAPIPQENKMEAIREFKNLHIAIYAPLYVLVEFGVNLHILEDLTEEEDKVTDSYQLPFQVAIHFLQLRGLEEQFSDCEETSVSESSSMEEEEESSDVLLELSVDEVLEAKEEMKEVVASSKVSEEKSVTAQSSPKSPVVSRTLKKKKSKREEPLIKRGEKNRKVLKKIHKALRMAPDRVNGSHLVFAEGVSFPFHGGGGSLAPGLARSLGKQFQALRRRENYTNGRE